MADDFIQRQYDDYMARKMASDKAKKLRWQRQLREYKKKLSQQKTSGDDQSKKD